MGRCEQEPMGDRETQEGDVTGADRVDHRDHVLDGALDESTFLVREPIRRPDAAWIEPDVTAERRQAVQEVREPWFLPHHIDTECRRSRHQHVDRTVPHDLVRDVPSIRRLREPLSGSSTVCALLRRMITRADPGPARSMDRTEP